MAIKNPNTTAPMTFVGNIEFKDLQENPRIVNNYKEVPYHGKMFHYIL